MRLSKIIGKESSIIAKTLVGMILVSITSVALAYADRTPSYITVEDNVSMTEREVQLALREAMRTTEAPRPVIVQYVKERPINVSLNQRLPIGVLAAVRVLEDSISVELSASRVASRILVHEMVHVVLYAMGVSGGPYGESHHEIMRENDWCYGACSGLHLRQK